MTKLKIGNVELNSNIVLAPMAGVTDSVLRYLVRGFSKDCLVMSEMVSSEALRMNPDRNITFAKEEETPICFQLSGHKPDFMAEASQILEPTATMIDINMGCPAPKIVKNGDGSSLIKTPKLASDIIKAVKNAVNIPVTVKTRLGWDVPSMKYIDFAKMVEDSGADAIIVHGRTRSQMYSGQANWEAIAQIKESVSIPVIANGDINSVEAAIECKKNTNCDGFAIGRGILGDIELIHRIEEYFKTGKILPQPTIQRRVELVKIHLQKEIEFRGELAGIRFMRKFFAYYVKNIKGASKYRFQLVQMDNHQEIISFLDEIAQTANMDSALI